MKCAECQKLGLKSTITFGMSFRHAVCGTPAWYDEDGNYHPAHDPNNIFQNYSCSQGHHFCKEFDANTGKEIVK